MQCIFGEDPARIEASDGDADLRALARRFRADARRS
jgi:hypothetical protein